MRHYEAGDRLPVETAALTTDKEIKLGNSKPEPGPMGSRFSRVMSAILLFVSYLLFLIPVFALLPALFSVIFGFINSRRRGLQMIALSPFVTVPLVSFFCGIGFYFYGGAQLQGYGKLDYRHSYLDPDLRCFRTSSGCGALGSEEFYQEPYNFALVTLIQCLGPMRGSYTGPYPSLEETFALIHQSSRRFPYSDFSLNPSRYGCPKDPEYLRLKNPYSEDPQLAIINYEGKTLIVGSEFNARLFARDSGQCYATYYFDQLKEFERWAKEEDDKLRASEPSWRR